MLQDLSELCACMHLCMHLHPARNEHQAPTCTITASTVLIAVQYFARADCGQEIAHLTASVQKADMRAMQATNEHAPSFKAGAQQGTGMETLSFQPLSLTFQDMCYWVTLPKGRELQLLKEVTGAFRPGVLTALVGVSGAG